VTQGGLATALAASCGVTLLVAWVAGGGRSVRHAGTLAWLLLAALVMLARFYAELNDLHAVILLAAPLCLWIIRIPPVPRLHIAWRYALLAVLNMLPLAFVVAQGVQAFLAATDSGGGSANPYADY